MIVYFDEPERNYPSNIFEKYLDLMHTKNSDQRLLIKVWIIAAFIPDIPHPISIPYGEKGSVKTTYCIFQKRLIDPGRIELLTVPQKKSEFVQQQYHNYLYISSFSFYDQLHVIVSSQDQEHTKKENLGLLEVAISFLNISPTLVISM